MSENKLKQSLLDKNYGKPLPPLESHKIKPNQRNLMHDFSVQPPGIASSPNNFTLNSPAITDDTVVSFNALLGSDVINELDQIDVPTFHVMSKVERGTILNKKMTEIDAFDGSLDAQKSFMRSIMSDFEYVMNQNDTLYQTVIKLVDDRKKVNDAIKTVNSLVKSIDNVNKRASRMDIELSDINNRMESAETIIESCYNSSRLGLIILDEKESEEIESGQIKPHIKIHQMLRYMNVHYSKSSIVNTFLATSRRMINGQSRIVKMLEIKFNDNVTAGRIFAHISKWNNEAEKNKTVVRYFAERPLGPKMLNLLKKSKQLLQEKKIIKAIPSEKGIKIKFIDTNRKGEPCEMTMFATCEGDLERFSSMNVSNIQNEMDKTTGTQTPSNCYKRKQEESRTSGSKKFK